MNICVAMGSHEHPSCITNGVVPSCTVFGTTGGLRPGCGSCHLVKDVPLCLPLMDHGHVGNCPSGESSNCFVPHPEAVPAPFLWHCLHCWDTGTLALTYTQAAETAVNMPFCFTQCLKCNHSQPLWSCCLQLSPSGDRRHR